VILLKNTIGGFTASLYTACCDCMLLKLCAQLLDSCDLCLRVGVVHSGICKYGNHDKAVFPVSSLH
jgi:hypothetical protein